jgi:hypothetical protein
MSDLHADCAERNKHLYGGVTKEFHLLAEKGGTCYIEQLESACLSGVVSIACTSESTFSGCAL